MKQDGYLETLGPTRAYWQAYDPVGAYDGFQLDVHAIDVTHLLTRDRETINSIADDVLRLVKEQRDAEKSD